MKLARLVLIAAAAFLLHEPSAVAQSPRGIDPNRLYQRVWTLVKDVYYDRTFNHQDWNYWRNRYDGKLHSIRDAHKAIETMLSSLGDPNSVFLDTDDVTEERRQIESRLVGIGVRLRVDRFHNSVVSEVFPDSPAIKAGIKTDDIITEVNGKPTHGLPTVDVVGLIKGVAGTEVALTIKRGDNSLKLTAKRAEPVIGPNVVSKKLSPEIGYLRIKNFLSPDTEVLIRQSMETLGSSKGLILDLRDNAGGSLTNTICAAKVFLPRGATILLTVDADGYENATYSDNDHAIKIPLVLIINSGTECGAEAFASALHDNGRALLVGQTSAGRGLVFTPNRLEDGSGVLLSIARFLTPNRIAFQHVGINPDIIVPKHGNINTNDEDTALNRAIAELKLMLPKNN